MTNSRLLLSALIIGATITGLSLAAQTRAEAPKEAAGGGLGEAIAAMRRITPADFSKETREAKAKELDAAWKTLVAAGKPAAELLKAELAKIDAAKEKDDYFKLGASVVLWQIAGLDEAPAIARVWSGDVALDLNYYYVFRVAMEASRTQDPRALPMLTAVLRDRKGSVFLGGHALNVVWPTTHDLIWCAFGAKGLPVLAQVLDESADPVAQESAVFLLAHAQYLPALPKIRQLAVVGRGGVRTRAIWNLGVYGHPQDYDFLVKGLASKDPKTAFDFAFALYEYEDLQAVPHLVPLLASADEQLCGEVVSCLRRLLTPPGFEALQKHAVAQGTGESAKRADANVKKILAGLDLTWEQYAAMPAAEKDLLLAALRRRAEEKFVLKPDDRRFSHEDLLEAAEGWKKNRCITLGTYAWVEDRHALAASTPADIDLWLEVKARVCLRLSDECLSEMETTDRIVRRLGRSRYRKVVGLCDKVEPLSAAAPAPAVKAPAAAPAK